MRIIHFINGFDPGGAEHGLLTLIENGFFDGHELRVLGMCRGKGALAERIRHGVGTRHFRIVEDSETLGFRARRAEGVYGCLLRAVSGRVDEVWADCQETLNSTRSYFKPKLRREAVVPLFCADDQMPAKNEYAMGPVLKLADAGRLVDQNPAMKPLAAKFLSRKYASAGNDCVKQGRRGDGIRYLFKALTKNPFAWRIYAYLAVAVMPDWLEGSVRRGFRHMRRQLQHSA